MKRNAAEINEFKNFIKKVAQERVRKSEILEKKGLKNEVKNKQAA